MGGGGEERGGIVEKQAMHGAWCGEGIGEFKGDKKSRNSALNFKPTQFARLLILHSGATTVNTTYLQNKMRDINTDGFLLGSVTILLAISSLLASSTTRHAGNTFLYSIVGLAIIFQYHLLSQVSMRNVPRETNMVDDC